MIIIESNIIYNFDDLKILLKEKTKEGSYFLLDDDIYFEKIEKNTVIIRDVLVEAKKAVKNFGVMKYLNFNMKDNYSTQEIFSLVQILRVKANIVLTIFNPKDKECNIFFISNKEDEILLNHIKRFLEFEVV